MYRKILVPLDGSALAEEALDYVRALVVCADAEVVLLRVTPVPTYMPTRPEAVGATRVARHLDPSARVGTYPTMSGPNDSARVQRAVETAELYLEAVDAKLKDAGFRTRVVTRPGPIAEAILDTAHALDVDLIAMSTHGRCGLRRFLLGSVATQVVQHAQVPVLLRRATGLPATHPLPIKHILVALDGSPHAASVLPHVGVLAQCTRANVTLLRVVERTANESLDDEADLLMAALSTIPTERNITQADAEMELSGQDPLSHRQDEAQSYLDSVAHESAGWGACINTVVQLGDPAEAILDLAKSTHADVVAMSTHGLGGLRRFLLGSVADKVVRHADALVVLVRPIGK